MVEASRIGRRMPSLETLGLSRVLAEVLEQSGWLDPLQLQAAYDTEEEAQALLMETKLKDMPGKEALLASWSRELMELLAKPVWAALRKRLKIGDFFEKNMAQLPEPALPGSELLAVAKKFCGGKKWSSRLSRELPDESQDQRKVREARELQKWTWKFVEFFMAAEVPAAVEAKRSTQPERVLEMSLGAKRARTVRSRWKSWAKISLWLECCYKISMPKYASQMIDYLLDVVLHSGARSLPGQVAATLSFVEKAAGVQANDKVSTQALWLSAVENVAKQLQLKNTVVKKAPMPTRAILLALEMTVCSGDSHFVRMLAFCRLLKVWACLRFDDLQALQHRSLRLTTMGLTGVLSSTKVSGPGKKHWDLPIVVHRSATLSGLDWLQAGVELVCSDCFAFERDYFLPVPAADMMSYKKKMLSYAECAARNRAQTHQLMMPVFNRVEGYWEFSDAVELVPEPAGLFWSEHSERHWLPSMAALAGVAKDTRDFVGRWHLGLHQSSDYILTARQVVKGVQAEVMRYIFGVSNLDDESETMEAMHAFCISKEMKGTAATDATRRHSFPLSSLSFGGLHKPWVHDMDTWDPEEGAEAAAPELPAIEDEDLGQGISAPGSNTLYWISISASRGVRKLHRTGGCGSSSHNWEPLEALVEGCADARCRHCWRGEPDSEEDVSSGSSSSGSEEVLVAGDSAAGARGADPASAEGASWPSFGRAAAAGGDWGQLAGTARPEGLNLMD